MNRPRRLQTSPNKSLTWYFIEMSSVLYIRFKSEFITPGAQQILREALNLQFFQRSSAVPEVFGLNGAGTSLRDRDSADFSTNFPPRVFMEKV